MENINYSNKNSLLNFENNSRITKKSIENEKKFMGFDKSSLILKKFIGFEKRSPFFKTMVINF